MSRRDYNISERFIVISDEHLAIMGTRFLIDKHFKDSNFLVADSIKRFRELINQQSDTLSICIFFFHLTSENISKISSLIEEIRDYYPNLYTIFFVTPQTLQYTSVLVNSGSRGIILKTVNEQKIVEAIKTIIKGEFFIEKDIKKNMKEGIQLMPDEKFSLINSLSAREKYVLNKLLAGVRIKEISVDMGVSQSTASTYFFRLKAKLKVENIIELKKLIDSQNLPG